MYRNNSRTRTQTLTQTQTQNNTQNNTQNESTQNNSFTGSSYILGSRSNTNTFNRNSSQIHNEIMFAVITSNLQEVKRLIDSTNVNDIIDFTNSYTALHHAVRIKGNNSIIEYLMSIGANPNIKQAEGKDSIDLSIEANYRFLIDKLMKEKDIELDKIYNKFDSIKYENSDLKRKNKDLVEENNFLKKSSTEYIDKIENLKKENTTLKRKYEESDKAFTNLLKKNKKN